MTSLRDQEGKFVSGHSGNPSGRPANSLHTAVRRQLAKVVKGGDRTGYELSAEAIVDLIMAGDSIHVAMLMDREDPKTQRFEHGGLDAFRDETDRAIDEACDTPEGQAHIDALSAKAKANLTRRPAPPVGPPNELVSEDGSELE